MFDSQAAIEYLNLVIEEWAEAFLARGVTHAHF